MLRICSILVLLAFATPSLAGVQGAIRVIDGDTLDVGGVRVRLHGIDAPEVGQNCRTATGKSWDCGTWASRELRALYQGAQASCEAVDRDKYDRVVATCRVAGHDLGTELVRRGMAIAFRKYSMIYVPDENRARKSRVGLHAGTFQNPSAHRTARKKAAEESAAGCRIKGNISKKGARIYHVPGQKFYAATRISTRAGERWFCSESDARAAGWRRAKR